MIQLTDIPKGWAWGTVEELGAKEQQTVLTGPFGTNLKSSNFTSTGVPILTIGCLTDEGIDLNKAAFLPPNQIDTLERYKLKSGDMLFSRMASVGRACIVPDELEGALFNYHMMRLRLSSEIYEPNLFIYYVRGAETVKQYLEDVNHGATRDGINTNQLLKMSVLIPPRAEQTRIIVRLEELLIRVDACRKRLGQVPPLLEQFRQSVLAAAFSGRLTENWRAQNTANDADWHANTLSLLREGIEDRKRGSFWGSGITASEVNEEWGDIPKDWQWVRVKDLGADPSEVVQIGPMSMKSNEFVSSGTRVLNVGCVQWGELNLGKCNYLPPQRARDFKRYTLKANDVLFTRSGTVGRSAIATPEIEGALITFHLLRVRTTPEICLPEYLYYTFQGCPAVLKQINSSAIGATRAGFNTRLLEELYIPLPPPQEQAEIIRTIQGMFESVKTVEERANLSFRAFDKLSQSILAKAFRGELVPQDPNDEPASVLLERIRTEKAETGKPEKKIKRTTAAKSKTAAGRSTLF